MPVRFPTFFPFLRRIRAGAPSTRPALALASLACLACSCGDGEGAATGSNARGGVLALSVAQIQGPGAASPYAGREVVTRGVVTLAANGGFFIQDPGCDEAAGASCGLFVFEGASGASAGQLVEVEGRVSEFDPGQQVPAAPGRPTVTELSPVRRVRVLGPGPRIAPAVLPWPAASAQALRRHEGMLVTVPGPFTVQQTTFLGRYGEVTLATGGRLMMPTEQAAPGDAARAVDAQNRRRSLLLDDATSTQDPNPVPYLGADGTLRAGDTVATLTGVLDTGLASPSPSGPLLPRLQPAMAPTFLRTAPRPARPAPVGGEIRLASANLDNFFTTLADGHGRCAPSHTPADCRGARSAAEFARQEAKLVEELVGLDADAIALMEVENDGGTTLHHLVGALNARLGTPAYAAVPDPDTGMGRDAIRVALIYRPLHLQLVGPSASDPAGVNSRAPLAQTFEPVAGGGRFLVVVSHFKSKDCTDAASTDRDMGDGQGCWNARRAAQSAELLAFAADVARRTGTDDELLLGDFNAYTHEDPVRRLVDAGWVDETTRCAPGAYSYIFDGSAGQLDHVFASPRLSARVTGAADWHINADEPAVLDYSLSFKQPACGRCAPDGYTVSPYRASDHDPVVIGISAAAGRQTSPPRP